MLLGPLPPNHALRLSTAKSARSSLPPEVGRGRRSTPPWSKRTGRSAAESSRKNRQGGRGRLRKARHCGLSDRLREEFGKGYDRSNLFHMRAFFLAYPIVDAVRRQLSWTHYRLLLRVDKSNARAFYETEAINARWSTRELERQINSLLFDRLAVSRDKAGVLALA